MAGDETFNQLTSELSLEERKNLLDKLTGHSSISPTPLYEEPEEDTVDDIETQYAQLPWYYHLWYFLLSFFKAKSPINIYADQQVAKLGKEIERSFPEFYQYQRNQLCTEFYNALVDLKKGARFFYNALDASVNRDKGAFYAFLGSLELGEAHNRLKAETDPRLVTESNPAVPEAELRQIALGFMEDILGGITENQRKTMYYDARVLYCLKELASFLFDRIIMAFSCDDATQNYTCSANLVREQLITLNNILYSIREPPPMTLLESLFVFILQDRMGEPEFDINTEMRTLLSRAENALASLRKFNKEVPLTAILRCTSRNLSLSPKAISGGEDWFIVFREHWKRQIEMLFTKYLSTRRRQEILDTLGYFFNGTNLKMLGNAASDSNPEGIPLKTSFALSFLLTFYSAVFIRDINMVIRPILIDGDFYKPENRIEFTESYNELIKLEDLIKKFEGKIASIGDFGKRYALARGEMIALPAKRRKIQIVMEEVDEEAEEIIEHTTRAMRVMVNVLGGIIKKDIMGKYDTLSNMAKLAGKGTSFVAGITESIQKFEKALHLLDDIMILEVEQ
jgi:hypothetical protein